MTPLFHIYRLSFFLYLEDIQKWQSATVICSKWAYCVDMQSIRTINSIIISCPTNFFINFKHIFGNSL